jgi:hypothetical protein
VRLGKVRIAWQHKLFRRYLSALLDIFVLFVHHVHCMLRGVHAMKI